MLRVPDCCAQLFSNVEYTLQYKCYSSGAGSMNKMYYRDYIASQSKLGYYQRFTPRVMQNFRTWCGSCSLLYFIYSKVCSGAESLVPMTKNQPQRLKQPGAQKVLSSNTVIWKKIQKQMLSFLLDTYPVLWVSQNIIFSYFFTLKIKILENGLQMEAPHVQKKTIHPTLLYTCSWILPKEVRCSTPCRRLPNPLASL